MIYYVNINESVLINRYSYLMHYCVISTYSTHQILACGMSHWAVTPHSPRLSHLTHQGLTPSPSGPHTQPIRTSHPTHQDLTPRPSGPHTPPIRTSHPTHRGLTPHSSGPHTPLAGIVCRLLAQLPRVRVLLPLSAKELGGNHVTTGNAVSSGGGGGGDERQPRHPKQRSQQQGGGAI